MGEEVEWPIWLNVSRETKTQFELLADMVAHWSKRINLVSRSSSATFWERHIFDSAQIYALKPDHCKRWLDLGSGAGFPGLVVAIMAIKSDPEISVTLVESDKRKAVFLREAARQLDLRVHVLDSRIESLPPLEADILSARALAPLSKLCGFANRHLRDGGIALFPKGQSHHGEIVSARKEWDFSLTIHTSMTDSSSVILEMEALKHV